MTSPQPPSDELSAEALRRRLPPRVSPIIREALASTSSELRPLAAGGASELTLIVAAEQSAGRGRRGRAFFSPGGSGVYFSLLLRPKAQDFSAARVTALAAVAAAEACEALFGVAAGIKWVNDVYVNGRKVAGILAEAFYDNGFYVILGIGANIAPPPGAFPADLPNAGAMTASPPPMAREEYVAETVRRFLELYENGDTGTILERYRARSILTGRRVVVHGAAEPYTAEVIGIAEDFSLVTRRVAVGENGALRKGGVFGYNTGKGVPPAFEALRYEEVSLELENSD